MPPLRMDRGGMWYDRRRSPRQYRQSVSLALVGGNVADPRLFPAGSISVTGAFAGLWKNESRGHIFLRRVFRRRELRPVERQNDPEIDIDVIVKSKTAFLAKQTNRNGSKQAPTD